MTLLKRIVCLLSAVISVGSVVLWVRSRSRADVLFIRDLRGDADAAASVHGGLMLAFSEIPFDGSYSQSDQDSHAALGRRVSLESASWEVIGPIYDSIFFDPSVQSISALGFHYASGPMLLTGQPPGIAPRFVALVAPWWFVAVLSAIVPFSALRRELRRRRRKQLGLCAQCGYDIRASNGLCPECGSGIPVQAQS